MKKRNQFILLVIGISFFSCNNATKKSIIPLSNIDTDFSVTEKLEFKPFNKYNILGDGICEIDDSTLWYFEDSENDFGACYDLNTGKKLSIIASRGEAVNELSELEGLKFIGDSVLLYANRSTIKTFAKKDIIDNIPMEDRKCSVITTPEDIFVHKMTKLPNGSTLATIRPPFEFEKKKINEINKKSVAIFNDNEANSYETIKYDSFDVEEATRKQRDANELIKWAYAQGDIEIKDNDMAVFSVCDQFILYTFDLNGGKMANEKRYTKILRTEGEMSYMTTNDMHLSIEAMKVNDKYILCQVDGYFSEEDKESELQKEIIFVFDWDLNPIKKFELPNPEEKEGYYTISNDCKSVYFYEYNDEGITLHKADLNI